MKVFCYQTQSKIKKSFMFNIYDKDGKESIPIINLRDILTNELFVRSHYSEVDMARQNHFEKSQILSSCSDRVMKEVMIEIMDEYDKD